MTGWEILASQADAWHAVVAQLLEGNPRMFHAPGSGQENAIAEITRLQTRVKDLEARLGVLGTLRKVRKAINTRLSRG